MVARPSPRLARRAGLIAVCATLLSFAGLLLGAGASPAAAQGYGWFGNLFGGGRPSQAPAQPNYPGYEYGPSQDSGDGTLSRHRVRRHAPSAAQGQRKPSRDAAADKPPPPKKNASAFVYVFGDTLGQFLANGLDEALADRQDVAVVHKARGPSGLVNLGFYDWPKTIDAELAGKDKIDVAVMMLGSNDRQPITENGKTYEVGSDEWSAIYKRRVMAIDEAFRKKGIPLIWVGVPIAKATDFADAMAMLNEIYRDAAAKTGATYVDTWEAFSDDSGEFAAYGPDVDGQTVRLRSADGILFTHAGARKLAHFVEAHIRRDLDGKAPAPVLPTGTAPEAQTSSAKDGKGAEGQAAKSNEGRLNEGKGADGKREDAKEATQRPAAKPEAGPITNLNQAPVATNGELASPTAFRGNDAAAALARGEPTAAPTGRADDARWPSTPPKTP